MIGSSFYISDSTNSEVHPAGSGNKSRKSGKIKVYEYPTCDISFFIFFHGELIFNVGFIKFGFLKNILEDFSKYFLKIFHNYKIIMKYNKIE